MILGRVVGTVVTTIAHGFYAGKKQLLVRHCLPDGTFDGESYILALDLVGAGPDELVLVEDEGNSARQLMGAPDAPVRSVIAAIVDNVSVE